MSAEATEDETIADLAMRATHWRSEAKRFAGQPEAVACLDYAEHIEVLAEVLRLEQLDDLAANGQRSQAQYVILDLTKGGLGQVVAGLHSTGFLDRLQRFRRWRTRVGRSN